MRRTLFYLSVALLAFGIGLFIVFNFYSISSSELTLQPKPMVNETKTVAETIVAETQKIEFNCDDEVINTIWKRLMENKSFADDAYNNVIEPNHIKDCRELFADVEPIKLNDGKSQEFIVGGNQYLFCDSGGDCQTWIVSKSGDRYEIVFQSTAEDYSESHSGKDIQAMPTQAHQFKDLKVFIPNGWDANNVGYFRFDGKQYQIRKCLRDVNSAYVYDSDYVEKWVVVKTNECLQRNML